MMKKYSLLAFLLFIGFEVKAIGDTVIAVISHQQFKRHIIDEIGGISNFYLKGDTLVWGQKIYLAPRDTGLVRRTELFHKSCFGKYFIFKTRSGIKVAEGRWFIESFIGPFKAYHKNGKIKEEGTFSADTARKPIGIWHYYSRKGVRYKSVNFSSVNTFSKYNRSFVNRAFETSNKNLCYFTHIDIKLFLTREAFPVFIISPDLRPTLQWPPISRYTIYCPKYLRLWRNTAP
ncbi:MAG: hypothetical protein IM638_10430 [Bacteroidetes bacterium]|nr:hypothetical protein [Bacteroidota bacterium]